MDERVMVRSAYHAINNRQSAGAMDEDATTDPGTSSLWPVIWKARVWPKVQAFMWKLESNSIATKANLVRRGVPTYPLCQICYGVESREHIFLECSWVRHVWFGLLGLHVAGLHQVQMDQWFCSLFPQRQAGPRHPHSSSGPR